MHRHANTLKRIEHTANVQVDSQQNPVEPRWDTLDMTKLKVKAYCKHSNILCTDVALYFNFVQSFWIIIRFLLLNKLLYILIYYCSCVIKCRLMVFLTG